MSPTVRFLTREHCSLCAAALAPVRRHVEAKGWTFEIVDVDGAGLDWEYGDRVPVVLVDGNEVLSGRFGSREIRRAFR